MQDIQVNKACDKAILELSNGNKDALSIIYDNMSRMIFSVAYVITGQYQDAEDVLQNTMIEITKYAHKYQSGSNAKAWILTMVRHCSIDIIRKRKPTISIDDTTVINIPDSNIDLSQLEVLDMLNVLEDNEKQILVLRLYVNMPYKEIAKIMKISIPSAQKKYQRILKKLKSYDL